MPSAADPRARHGRRAGKSQSRRTARVSETHALIALTLSQQRIRALVDAVAHLIWTTGADGNVITPQPNWQAFTGSTFEDIRDFGWLRFVHPDDRDRLEALWRTWLAADTPGESEFRLRRHDGAYLRFLVRAMPVRDPATGRTFEWVGIHEDITPRRRAEAELRQRSWELGERVKELECLYRAASLCGDNALPIADIAHGMAAALPPAMRVPDRAAAEIRLGDEVFATGDAPPAGPPLEHPLHHKGVKAGHIHVFYTGAVEPYAGEIYLTEEIALLRVLAQMLQQAMDRRRAAEAMAQAQKLEAIGQLTGGIAHDFNNLLTVVLANADIVAVRAADPALRQIGEMIMNAAESGAALTRRLLAFARQQELAPQRIDPAALVRGLVPLLKRTLGSTIVVEVEVETGGDTGHVLADQAQLESALLNFAINARDAMPEGGRIAIAVRRETVPPGASDAGLAPGDYVAFSVRDTGHGMTRDVLGRAIEPFFTTKPVGKGTGLGLSMAYGFATQSGGALRLASEPAKGTTVTILLPAQAGAARGDDTAAGSSAPTRLPLGCRVLIVEDEPVVRRLAVDALLDAGAVAVEAASGPEALARLEIGRAHV